MTAINLPILDREPFAARFTAPLKAAVRIRTLQINIGYVCNLACRHCHVESSPARNSPEENMQRDTAEKIVQWAIDHPQIDIVDFTGGSPEMNPNFEWMVRALRDAGRHIMDRCNPTIIDHFDRETGRDYAWIPQFLADHQVEVVASMPCYLAENVNQQRGRNAYNASIEGLQQLNAVGYGSDPALRLNLVYNPNGPHLPPPQEALAEDYRRELKQRFGLVFNELWTITNMPIKRWRYELERTGKLEPYMELLINAYNPNSIDGLMCRHQISVDPQGFLYDCDFNQALGMRVPRMQRKRLWEVSLEDLTERPIATADHCYGCTAGAGSSCGGAIVS